MAFNSNISNFTTQQIFEGGGGINNTPSAPSTSSDASTSTPQSGGSQAKVAKFTYDIEKIEDIAFFLSREKDQLELDISNLNNWMVKLKNGWTGDIAESYLNKIQTKIDSLISTISNYDIVISNFRNAASSLRAQQSKIMQQMQNIN